MRKQIGLILLIALSLFSSCKVFYPNILFKTPRDYPYATLNQMPPREYRILPGDRLSLQVYSNEAYNQVITMVQAFENQSQGQQTQIVTFLVGQDSLVELPVIGKVNLTGMTIPQAQDTLKTLYARYYQDPLVAIEVTNRRVIVFNGSENATVVPLENENTSLVEVLAAAGGIDQNAKAYRIKIIRGDLENPQIALVDLSTVEGMRQAEMTVQANDIIYVEPTTRLTTGLWREISPVIGIITSITTLYLLISNLTSAP